MAPTRTNAGDPDRTLALLWRDPEAVPRRGPRQSLSLDRVVEAAVVLADREGLSALSMRKVADALGVSTMTTYTYVPGKAELLDLMLDAAYRGMPMPALAGLPWRGRLTSVADGNRAFHRAHPWAAAVSTHRPSLGPGQMAKYEYELHAFDGLGLSDLDRDSALSHLLAFVRQHALAEQEAGEATLSSSQTDEQWWAVNAPLLGRVLDPDVFPLAVRVGAAVGAAHGSAWDADRAWEFGLARTLDGFAGLVGT
ncbi:TetR/AcrR family transcriptional regulator [Pseudonocardia tropica]|uniref:TetR/AcrR family transcriptional regulator n=1 Tax=Pseudonocardia tropica TaxID=681289 RepID=A0ABV1JP43_9PSEU